MSAETIDLLLADPRQYAPVLDAGISTEAIGRAPKPRKDETHLWRARGKDRSDLPQQRWGIVAPQGKDGDALLAAMRPLIELRAEEQGERPIEFRIPPNMNRKAASEWLFREYEAEEIDESDRPMYLCLLGNPERASLEFQQTIAHNAYVGRVHFDKLDGTIDVDAYAAYAEKVVKYARGSFTAEPPELLYFAARDGSRATMNAIPKLVLPSIEAAQRAVQRGKLNSLIREVEADSVDSLLDMHAGSPGGKPRPAVFFSVSHGLGGSKDDYGSYDAQRRRQGALVLGRKELLDAEAIAGKTFLPGGLWLCFACFGAGTPVTSEYFRWLDELAKLGVYRDSAQIVLNSLALSGNGFISALPQAALRNPNGPLAVIGNIDLAWNFSYIDVDNPSESRSSKFTRALQAMASGERVGVAHDEITEWFRNTNHSLSSMYEASEDARIRGRADPIDPKKRGPVWLLRNDLRGYVLLGDPAVRLSRADPAAKPSETESIPEIQGAPAEAGDSPEAGDVPEVESPRDAAVRALVEGNEAPRTIAARAGCSLTELFDWFEAHWATKRPMRG